MVRITGHSGRVRAGILKSEAKTRVVAPPRDGLIVPDLPVEESEGLRRLATALDLRLIQLVTPTTPRDRALRIAENTTGFLYYVSVAGITGVETSMGIERMALMLGKRASWFASTK